MDVRLKFLVDLLIDDLVGLTVVGDVDVDVVVVIVASITPNPETRRGRVGL